MKKIMFNDKYGLIDAVLQGRKTMTRRIITNKSAIYSFEESEYMNNMIFDSNFVKKYSRYQVNEIVAVAQSYKRLANSGTQHLGKMMENPSTIKKEYCGAGWDNKMFVKASYMPNQIKITDIKIERLQDISEEDALKEGVLKNGNWRPYNFGLCGFSEWFETPRKAFAILIDKVSGKGTWDRNPWVFAYEFELVK